MDKKPKVSQKRLDKAASKKSGVQEGVKNSNIDDNSQLDTKVYVKTAAKSNQWPACNPEMRLHESLRPSDRNPRKHTDKQIDQIASSVREFGITFPILIAENSEIIAGEGVWKGLGKLGYDEVPVIIAKNWTADQIKAYRIADNQLALNSGWDISKLAIEISELQESGFAVDLIGFDPDELSDLLTDDDKYNTDKNDIPDSGPKPITKKGDVWLLGNHRLVCGDSTKVDDVEILMNKTMADAVWTDPPYNVAVSKWGREGIANDEMSDSDFVGFLLDSFVTAFSFMKPGSAIYVASADLEAINFQSAFKSAGFHMCPPLVWAKNSFVVGRSDYQYQHEPIIYGWKPGDSHRWYGDRKQSSVIELDGNVFTKNQDGSITVRVGSESLVITGNDLQARAIEPSVIRVDRPTKSKLHPTTKPVELIERQLKNSTRKGDIVLDLFGGSGSTMIACEVMGRNARLVEIDQKYCDIIVKRWQEFTGHDAELESSGSFFNDLASKAFSDKD